MIFAWLTARGLLGLKKGWWLLILAGVAFALWWAVGAYLDRLTDAAREQGATEQREADLVETIERVKEAKDAAQKLDTDPDARRAGCLRHSRTPENC